MLPPCRRLYAAGGNTNRPQATPGLFNHSSVLAETHPRAIGTARKPERQFLIDQDAGKRRAVIAVCDAIPSQRGLSSLARQYVLDGTHGRRIGVLGAI